MSWVAAICGYEAHLSLRKDCELPLDPADSRRVLVMVLGRQSVPLSDTDFVPAGPAPIDTCICRFLTGLVEEIIGSMIALCENLRVFVLSH